MFYLFAYNCFYMRAQLVIWALLLVLAASTCPKVVNQKELLFQQNPQVLKTVPNGVKMLIGDLNDPEGNYIYVAKLQGTFHQMGFALGQLFADEIKANIKAFYDYYLGSLEDILIQQKVPLFIAKGLTNSVHTLALNLLDLNIMITKKYTNKRYYEEIAGIAAGAKIHSKDISRLNIFPEIIKAACTVAGVWGPASMNRDTLHVRSLDWDAGNPISKYPLISVYHPVQSGLQKHANIGWAGFVGVLTGISPHVSLGEKVWYPPSGSVKTTRYGNPWTYVLRDVLYQAKNMQEALQILSESHRTCSIHLGLGSSHDHSFRMLQYAEKTLNNYDDKNYTHYAPNHPKKDGIAYFDKRVQPSGDDCVGSLLTDPKIYGKWEMESLWRIVGKSHTTGDTQLVVFNLEKQVALISYSRVIEVEKKTKTENAYDRSPIWVDFGELWKDI